jgi:hypothetical protein
MDQLCRNLTGGTGAGKMEAVIGHFKEPSIETSALDRKFARNSANPALYSLLPARARPTCCAEWSQLSRSISATERPMLNSTLARYIMRLIELAIDSIIDALISINSETNNHTLQWVQRHRQFVRLVIMTTVLVIEFVLTIVLS